MINKIKLMSKKNKRNIKWSLIAGFVVLIWFAGRSTTLMAGVQRAVLATGTVQPDISDKGESARSAATEMHLFDENGKQVSLSDFVGKTVFFNVWATWCPPCKAEMPGIQNLYEEVKNENVEFVMLSTDRDFELAKRYKKQNGYSFPIYRMGSNFPAALNGNSIPRTYVLDGEGAVRMEHTGMAQYDTEKFKGFLSEIIGESSK